MAKKSLDAKLAAIRAGKYKPTDFIIADAKDGDIGFGTAAPGPDRDKPGRFKTRAWHLDAIRDMIADYNKLYDAWRGVARAEVTSAAALSDAHIGAIKDALKTVTGGKEVEVSTKIDPAIIGGLIVKLGSRMVDGSLRTKLNSIRTRMKEVG